MDNGLRSRAPGIFANLRYGLYLKFQLNPDTLTITKPTNYATDDIPGQSAPFTHWTSGGAKTISFELMFDRTEGGRSTGLFTTDIDLNIGVMDIEAVLESFLYPRNPVMEKLGVLNLPSIEDFVSTNKFLPPPEIYFIYGLRWYKCHLKSSPFVETIHNKYLVPMRVNTTIELEVVEDGMLDKVATLSRLVLALSSSISNLVGLSPALTTQVKSITK